MTDHLVEEIVQLGKRKTWKQLRNFDESKRTFIREKRFRWAVPAEDSGSMANVLNAAWDLERNPTFWNRHPSLGAVAVRAGDGEAKIKNDKRRREALHELVLKNIEVLEYEDIVRRPLPNA